MQAKGNGKVGNGAKDYKRGQKKDNIVDAEVLDEENNTKDED
jgi:hypothetical protein